MRVVLGLLVLLLSQGRGHGQADEIGEVQKAARKDAAEEPTEETTKQPPPDIWAEVRALRDMVVELGNMKATVKESERQVEDLKTELMVTKAHMGQLQRRTTGTFFLLRFWCYIRCTQMLHDSGLATC